ncbi:carotenoid ester lipase precursor [Roridomyces roridus]|uniref:Carboxylic ester hydrolase n=1 Tax=Roridomyces roridus TaxID=1738132 RepID=A0AAD7BYU9_9AGAR|nr:carotenoid ester lipase precursor [Roridomyces roridus]
MADTMIPFVLPSLLALNSMWGGGAPTVSLDYGIFQGSSSGNISMFLGVPFSQPVTRFELPKPPVALEGVQDATVLGPACPQQEQAIKMPIKPHDFISEDCLTLNILKPAVADANSKLPVFVYIHSGGFEIGNNEEGYTRARPLLDRGLATDQPFVFVAPNYRLSAFGFLAGKEAVEAGITNLGLRDQIFALEWVQKNIAAFGGDPQRVVLGGVSAGAISTALLTLNNKLFDEGTLFRGAFLSSGSIVTTSTVLDGQSDYDFLLGANNCTDAADTLECLKRVPFADFMRTVNRTPNLFSVFQSQDDVEAEGLYAKIPIVAGVCDDEGTLFTLPLKNITTNKQFEEYISSNYLPNATPQQIAKISALYPDDPSQGSPFGTGQLNIITPQFKRLAAFQGDHTFAGARRFFLQGSAERRMWSWVSKRNKTRPMFGAGHASDFSIWLPKDEDAVPGRETFASDALVNFINTLDPNRPAASAFNLDDSVIFWPAWDVADPPSLLMLSDDAEEGVLHVGKDDFRTEAIAYLYALLLEDAERREKR